MTTTTTRRPPGGKKKPPPGRDAKTTRIQPNPPPREKFGTRLLSESDRARLENHAAGEGNPFLIAWARFRLHIDDLRQATRAGKSPAGKADQPHQQRRPAQPARGVATRLVEYRGTTSQVAGLWPWAVGAGVPILGVPLGPHLETAEPVCFDLLNWFKRGRFITAPILFVLGLNGFGKSTFVRRLVLGGLAQGIRPLVLADVKPDYRKVIEMCGGQVVDLGYGHGTLNPLDSGVMGQALQRLEDAGKHTEAEILRTEIRARTTNLIAGLIELVRGKRIGDYEETLISVALRILYLPEPEGGRGFTLAAPPIFDDLTAVIAAGSGEGITLDPRQKAQLHLAAAARDDEEYRGAIIDLLRSLVALTEGNFGSVFNGQTSEQFDLHRVGVCVDVSHIANSDKKLKAAVMLASWSQGFGAVDALNLLTDAGLERQHYFQVVMDELWQVLSLGEFMIDRVDELTRLQRGLAVALIMISHTIKDLQSLGSEASISKALGFLERARVKVFGALPAEEIRRLDSITPFTESEAAMVTSWSAPQALTSDPIRDHRVADDDTDENTNHQLAPGTGKFLLKIGEDRQPGIPFYLEQTSVEADSGVNATSARFDSFASNEGRAQ